MSLIIEEKHTFRAPEELDNRRQWIRDTLPHAREGCVVEDLDLVIRIFDPQKKNPGRFFLAELKWEKTEIDSYGQLRTFQILDSYLKYCQGNAPEGHGHREIQYMGFYLITWPMIPRDPDEKKEDRKPPVIDFSRQPIINGGIPVEWDVLADFLEMKPPFDRIDPYDLWKDRRKDQP